MDIPLTTCHFLLLLKISRNLNCFGKINWSMISGQRRAGDSLGYKKKSFLERGIARDIKKILFKTLQKMVPKLRQFAKPGPYI